MKKVEVVAGVIEFENKILCAKRDISKFDYISNKFEFPGGKIEEGETNEQTLERELIEEMEMNVLIGEHFIEVVHEYPDFELTMQVYLCKATSMDVKLNVHKEILWLEKKDLAHLDWAAADIPVVEKLLAN